MAIHVNRSGNRITKNLSLCVNKKKLVTDANVKLTSSFRTLLFITKFGGMLPLSYDGKKLQYQAFIHWLSAIPLIAVIGGYLTNMFILQEEVLTEVSTKEIVNVMLDVSQFIGSLCCFISAVVYKRLFRDSLNKSLSIYHKYSPCSPSVWQVIMYIILEFTELLYPPRGIIPTVGKLQIVSAITVIATVMVILEDTLKNVNEEIQQFSNNLQEQTSSKKLLLYSDEPCTNNYKNLSLHYSSTHWIHFKVILKELQDTIKDLNSASGIILVFNIIKYCFFFTIHLYRLIIEKFPAQQFYWAFLSFLPIFFLCQRFESLQEQVNKTKSIVSEVDLSSLDERSQTEVKLLQMQMESYSWNIAPMGMFHMDFSVVLWIIMTTLTYIILLRQMIGKQMEA